MLGSETIILAQALFFLVLYGKGQQNSGVVEIIADSTDDEIGDAIGLLNENERQLLDNFLEVSSNLFLILINLNQSFFFFVLVQNICRGRGRV